MAIEVHDPKGFGRIRVHRMQGPTIDALMPFVRENVTLGATIRTDGSAIYGPLMENGFGHEPFVQLASKTPAHMSLPGEHRVISLLKRWLLGTHQGAVDPRHVDYYLDEFTFRFNPRSSRSRGMLFYRLLQQSAATTPVTYVNIRDNEHPTLLAPVPVGLVELNGQHPTQALQPAPPRANPAYRTVAEHFEAWLELSSAGQFDGQGDHHTPSAFVRQAFRKCLECGHLAHGFARARCDDCGHDYFVAYSCKGRGGADRQNLRGFPAAVPDVRWPKCA